MSNPQYQSNKQSIQAYPDKHEDLLKLRAQQWRKENMEKSIGNSLGSYKKTKEIRNTFPKHNAVFCRLNYFEIQISFSDKSFQHRLIDVPSNIRKIFKDDSSTQFIASEMYCSSIENSLKIERCLKAKQL